MRNIKKRFKNNLNGPTGDKRTDVRTRYRVEFSFLTISKYRIIIIIIS